MARAHVPAFVALLLLAMVSACGQRVPKVSDQSIQDIRAGLPGITEECLRTIRFGEIEAMPSQVDACFHMLPTQRWKGLWRDDFEGSRFCPAPTKTCSFDSPGEAVWLTFRVNARPPQRRAGGLYEIEFVGRRTLRRGGYGHLGEFQHEVLVDKVISLNTVDEGQR